MNKIKVNKFIKKIKSGISYFLNPISVVFFVILYNYIGRNQNENIFKLYVLLISLLVLFNVRSLFRDKWKILCVIFIFGIYIVVTYYSGEVQDVYWQVLNILFLLLCTILGILLQRKREFLFKGLKFFEYFIILCGFYGIYEYTIKFNYISYKYCQGANLLNRYYWQFNPNSYRVATVFIHPILYSVLIAFVILFVFYYEKNKFIKYGSLLLLVINIYLTKSRTSWVALAIVFCLVILDFFVKIIKKGKIEKSILSKILLSICLLPGVVIFSLKKGYIQSVFARFNNLFKDTSTLQRTGTLNYFIKNIFPKFSLFKNMLGHGEGASAPVMSNLNITMSNFAETDNQFLTTAYNSGFIALILVLIFIIYSVCLFFSTNDKGIKFVSICFFMMNITMFFFELYRFTTVSFWYFIFLGFLIGTINLNIRREYYE